MGRLFVRDWRGFVSVNFGEDKSRWIILLLRDIESDNSGVLDTSLGVQNCRFAKRVDRLRFNMDVNVEYQHDPNLYGDDTVSTIRATVQNKRKSP